MLKNIIQVEYSYLFVVKKHWKIDFQQKVNNNPQISIFRNHKIEMFAYIKSRIIFAHY